MGQSVASPVVHVLFVSSSEEVKKKNDTKRVICQPQKIIVLRGRERVSRGTKDRYSKRVPKKWLQSIRSCMQEKVRIARANGQLAHLTSQARNLIRRIREMSEKGDE